MIRSFVQRLLQCSSAACGCALLFSAAPAGAQLANEGHDHLHFSHPMVTESPSPDTKLRFDFIHLSGDDPPDFRANEIRVEGEYGFTDQLSLAVVAPFVSVTSPSAIRASALGNIELQLKASSLRWDERGMLVGGGISAALPTGDDSKGIGSGHIFELEPFVDVALRRGALETVAFLSLSSTFNERAGEDREKALRLNASALLRVSPEIELLAEIATTRQLNALPGVGMETFIAPGVKWRPTQWPALALGASFLLGVDQAKGTNALQLSAFYHF